MLFLLKSIDVKIISLLFLELKTQKHEEKSEGNWYNICIHKNENIMQDVKKMTIPKYQKFISILSLNCMFS